MNKSRTKTPRTTRKQFLVELSGVASTASALGAQQPNDTKILAVVAHPDDEYAFAAFAYRVSHELQGRFDQVVITNGEGGYRYSQLAEAYYGVPLSIEAVGRHELPHIRKQEAKAAGRILGIRTHWFLEQRDARFTLDSREALAGLWDTDAVVDQITAALTQGGYSFVVVMLPTRETHGHHQAAALLAAEAIQRIPVSTRPVLLGAEASGNNVPLFQGRPEYPLLRTRETEPRWRVHRMDSIPNQRSLTYNVIVNWVIAEHKSQGLFQTETGRHAFENFWLFETGTPEAGQRAQSLFDSLHYPMRSRR